MVGIDGYRSIVGKIMYYVTKIAPEICNAVRELAGHLSSQEKTIGQPWSDVLAIWQVKEQNHYV
jgi:hypothetical protein